MVYGGRLSKKGLAAWAAAAEKIGCAIRLAVQGTINTGIMALQDVYLEILPVEHIMLCPTAEKVSV